MAKAPSVLILDDGELDDIQLIVEDLAVDFARVRGGAIAPNTPQPKALLMATPRRISAVSEIASSSTGGDAPVRVVVVDQDSKTLRDQLRQVGFDYLVRRPVHPEALRLLVMHSLYRGEEKRGEPRVAVGLEISFQTGEIPRRATLVDLSTGGCRLISSFELESGKRILVTLPESVGATESITLEGKILRSSYDKRIGEKGMHSAAVRFENLSSDLKHELEWIIEDKIGGPPALNAGKGPAAPSPEQAAQPYTVKRPQPSRAKRRTLLEKDSEVLKRDPRAEGATPGARRAPE
ncbi:MAG TPA: PilZ domain-containing protein, partial [Myxococcota bacterium]|nr:PilZ domain-containing protein [Myxococcota bacterium]